MKIAPPVLSAIEVREPRTIAPKIQTIDFQLGEIIRQVAEHCGHDSKETIDVLEAYGLETALTFVQPLLIILKSDRDSPLRKLSTFEISALFVENMRKQEIVLSELEDILRSGQSITIRTGTANVLFAQYRARVQVAKDREGTPAAPTRDDLTCELVQLKEKVELLTKALTTAAEKAGCDVNEFIDSLLDT